MIRLYRCLGWSELCPFAYGLNHFLNVMALVSMNVDFSHGEIMTIQAQTSLYR